MSAPAVRTQIYLPKRLHEALSQRARRQKTSMAQLLRESAERMLQDADTPEDPLASLLGAATEGPTDLAEQHDHYLYGAPTPKSTPTKRAPLPKRPRRPRSK